MVDEPEIVKKLRKEEKLGLLQEKSQYSYENLQIPEESSIISDNNTIMVSKEDIGTRKIDIKVEDTETIYKKIFENCFFAITITDENERIISWNKYTEQLLGMGKEDLFMKPVKSLYPSKEWEKIQSKNFKTKGLQNHLETKILKKNSGPISVDLSLCKLKSDEGKTIGSIGVIKDITEQKEMERRLNSIMECADDSIYLLDKGCRYIMANDGLLSRLSVSRDKLLGKSFSEFHTSKETDEFTNKFKQVLKNGKSIKDEHEKQGKWFLRTLSPIRDYVSDQITSVLVISKDITELKDIEDTLSKSEEKFRVVLEKSLDMIYQFNFETNTIDYVSPSSLKILGYDPKELISFELEKIYSKVHPEDKKTVNEYLEKLTTQKGSKYSIQSVEYRIKHKKLGYRWVNDTRSLIVDKNNKPIYIIGNVKDITDRKKVWDELVKSEERYRVLAETSADGVFTTDALGRLTYVNPAFEKMCGRRKSQILATLFRDYLLDDSIYFFQQIFIDTRKKDEKIENVELELVNPNNNIVPIEVNIAPLKKENEFAGMVCTVRDITQRRRIEYELKKSERLKTEFMNIAAHELKSPVTPIKGYLDLIIQDKDTSEKIKNWAKISLRNSDRLLKLVNDILDVSRLDTDTMRFEMEKLNTVTVISEVAEDMKATITGKKLEFIQKIPSQLPSIMGDKNRLSQVLKNILGNAIKFTDYGSITIGAKKQDDHILIFIEDTGVGISDDELTKIFTKFYQAYTGSDRRNEGTGLGLFICKEIIQKHNGEIWAESKIGKGSKFIIKLPYLYKMTVDFKR